MLRLTIPAAPVSPSENQECGAAVAGYLPTTGTIRNQQVLVPAAARHPPSSIPSGTQACLRLGFHRSEHQMLVFEENKVLDWSCNLTEF
ncbi:hypothetical protein AWJ19_01550 [Paenibacillus sp. DMB5]|nr:hypothetical protein AWJ19_01550 [Paenibacillus sp. DMB5]